MPLPPFDNSAMDGYAVRAADVEVATERIPVTLPVIDDVAAGDGASAAVGPGMATRIMTGAPLPAGADAVVPVEWTDGGTASRRRSARPAPAGNAIRRAGEDVQAGDGRAARRAPLIGPAQLGIVAGVGRRRVLVRPRPRVVVLVHRRRAGRAGPAARPRPDLGLQQLHPDRRRPRGRRRRLPGARPSATTRRPFLGPARRAAPPGRRRDHQRRRLHGRLRAGQGGARAARHRPLREGRHAARHAPGLRRRGRGPGADLRAARQPRVVVRLVHAFRTARAAAGCAACPPGPAATVHRAGRRAGALARRASGRSCAGVLDARRRR